MLRKDIFEIVIFRARKGWTFTKRFALLDSYAELAALNRRDSRQIWGKCPCLWKSLLVAWDFKIFAERNMIRKIEGAKEILATFLGRRCWGENIRTATSRMKNVTKVAIFEDKKLSVEKKIVTMEIGEKRV